MNQKQTIPFTKEAFNKLKADQANLQQKRVEVVARVQTAREMGDLSENGAYKYGKMELGDVGRKLRQLSFLLSSAVVTSPQKNGTVGFANEVTVTSEKGTNTFTLVSEHESDPSQNKLSMTGPIGKALMGKKAGDKVTIKIPAGTVDYLVNKVD